MANQMTYHSFVEYPSHPTLPGIIVPQQVYGQNLNFERHPPIRFFVNGRPGISLNNAINQVYQGLNDAQYTPTVTVTSTKTAIRVLWPGYEPWNDTVTVYDHTAATHMYTLAKLATATARAVRKFMTEMQNARSTEPRSDWWVQSVPFESLYLVELRHVSSGSWQPVLCRQI